MPLSTFLCIDLTSNWHSQPRNATLPSSSTACAGVYQCITSLTFAVLSRSTFVRLLPCFKSPCSALIAQLAMFITIAVNHYKNFLTSIKLLNFVCLTSSAHFHYIALMIDVILSAFEDECYINSIHRITGFPLLSSDSCCNFGDKKSSHVSDCYRQNRQRFV